MLFSLEIRGLRRRLRRRVGRGRGRRGKRRRERRRRLRWIWSRSDALVFEILYDTTFPISRLDSTGKFRRRTGSNRERERETGEFANYVNEDQKG